MAAHRSGLTQALGVTEDFSSSDTEMQITAPCVISPKDKKKQAKLVGDDLIRHHGKRRFYTVDQVKAANIRCHIQPDYICWSHALFNSRDDFDRLHAAAGQACDYVGMKAQMLESLTSNSFSDLLDFDFDLSWLEFPDIDWSIFDFFD